MEYLQLYQGCRGNSAAVFRLFRLRHIDIGLHRFLGIRPILENDSIYVFLSRYLQRY